MFQNELTPERQPPLPGSGTCTCDALRCEPDLTSTPVRIEAFASEYIARRYGLPVLVARVVAELAGIGGRVG